ncbi:hypothetical protein HYW76_05810 [Candidatus Pacearchaeota archaeon]|nr:hypothetical protein [Candidatus Pacearchaeota archaeon]
MIEEKRNGISPEKIAEMGLIPHKGEVFGYNNRRIPCKVAETWSRGELSTSLIYYPITPYKTDYEIIIEKLEAKNPNNNPTRPKRRRAA